ncbi:MAG TPA: methionine--tRNA ligase [Cyclobacteriaceae bacterium]
MSKEFKRYTVTAALPYANGPIHIGHLAGVYIPADIYVRYLRSKEKDVVFVCGSDEHGVAITLKARKEGLTPQQVVDKYHSMIKESFENFGIGFSIYHRTSSSTHHETASSIFLKLYEQGKLEEKTSEQFYDRQEKQFLADRYIIGTCPNCGNTNAYGDQCESCGTSLSPAELINPRSAISGAKPVLKETRHFYLPLNEYESWLRGWIIEGHKNDWKINVYGQCKSWIDNGLKPRAVTRDLDWGVPVPLKGMEGKVLYVWFDAPVGYISATIDWAKENGIDWKPYWQDKDTKLLHFIGKDNIVFHCIIFPVILKSHGDYILPENVPANEFLNLEGNKISTSRNWAVWLHEYLEEFPGKEDVLRYTLCANAPETKDNDFTWKDFQARNNNELVAIFGNFINRAAVLTDKFFNGVIPERGEIFSIDEKLIAELNAYPDKIASALEEYKFREALSLFMDLARLGNKYLAETEPWQLIKTNPERVKTILNLALQVAANLQILGHPFLPFTSKKLGSILKLESYNWKDSGSIDLIKPGSKLGKAELLFEKIEDDTIQYQIQKLENTRKENMQSNQLPGLRPEIQYDDFAKLDIRVGTILEAEVVPKSKKLLKIKLDTGLDTRTVLSGISEQYSPEEIIGRQVCVLANLAPRKMLGLESQGMILMSEDSDGKLNFIAPSSQTGNGSQIS